MNTLTKLEILADAAKYDVACTSSGSDRADSPGALGTTRTSGCCHSWTPDGRCVSLLKVLMTNACCYDCEYCVNRRSNSRPRATFEPQELADLTIEFYRRNFIEGLFLSSGVLGSPDRTTELMIECIRILRQEHRFRGYIHAKAIPGTSPELIYALGLLVDRMSVNIELPSQKSLSLLAPDKSQNSVLEPMAHIRNTIEEDSALVKLKRSGAIAAKRTKGRHFAPAGQSTQMIIGATPENDTHILRLAGSLYQTYGLKRVFFSAYLPVNEGDHLPAAASFKAPLAREHRLYQADWLLRFYEFDVEEIIPASGMLDLDLDPKCIWALNHMDDFPVELTTATLDVLLRIPGIGPTGARKIIRARKGSRLDEAGLRRIGIALARAQYFITVNGRYLPGAQLDPLAIKQTLIGQGTRTQANVKRRVSEQQLALF